MNKDRQESFFTGCLKKEIDALNFSPCNQFSLLPIWYNREKNVKNLFLILFNFKQVRFPFKIFFDWSNFTWLPFFVYKNLFNPKHFALKDSFKDLTYKEIFEKAKLTM